MKIRRTLKVRVRKHPDGLFTAEYKGLFFWHPCYSLGSLFHDIQKQYLTVEDAKEAVTAYAQSRIAADQAKRPIVEYETKWSWLA